MACQTIGMQNTIAAPNNKERDSKFSSNFSSKTAKAFVEEKKEMVNSHPAPFGRIYDLKLTFEIVTARAHSLHGHLLFVFLIPCQEENLQEHHSRD